MVNQEFGEASLFFGFLLDASFQEKLQVLDPAFKSLFIQQGDDYLQEYNGKEGLFLGKFLGKKSDFATLEAFSLNIYSLLTKILPNYPYKSSKLMIIPVLYVN